jgi:chromosome segregation ATPase
MDETAPKTLMREIYSKDQQIKTITRQKIEIERKYHHKVNEVTEIRKRESINIENIEKLMNENQKLKLIQLKKAAGSSKPLKNRIKELEETFNEEIGSKTVLVKEKDRSIRQLTNEVKRMKMKLTDADKKMKLREEEISLLEEKILGLQKNIRYFN